MLNIILLVFKSQFSQNDTNHLRNVNTHKYIRHSLIQNPGLLKTTHYRPFFNIENGFYSTKDSFVIIINKLNLCLFCNDFVYQAIQIFNFRLF